MENKGYLIVHKNSERGPYHTLISLVGTEKNMKEDISNLEKGGSEVYACKFGIKQHHVESARKAFPTNTLGDLVSSEFTILKSEDK